MTVDDVLKRHPDRVPPRPPVGFAPRAERRAPVQALSPAERAAVPGVLNTVGNADLSIVRVWFRELDEGRYWCSLSSMCRIARAAGQTRERRAQATHPAMVKPELMADAPTQVWSWDIERHEALLNHSVVVGIR